jgi:nucleoside-diphosphate-sugar epimerase
MSQKPRSVLITGGAGYIGSNLAPTLLAKGYSVRVIDNFMWGVNSLAACCAYDGFDIIKGDARDERILKDALKGVDIVVPLAALVGAPLCKQDPIGATTINRDAVLSIVKHTSKDQWILYPNTNSGYGLGQGDKHCTEDSPLKPISLYGTSKCEAEEAIHARGNAISFRLATVFGVAPRMRVDLLVNDFVYRAVNDRFVVLFESHFKRNYIHNRDVTNGFIHGIENFDRMKDQAYNMGLSDANLSKLELCQKIAQHVPGFVFFESKIGEDPDKRDYIVSNEKLERTGWKAEWSLDRGIKELKRQYVMIKNNQYANF